MSSCGNPSTEVDALMPRRAKFDRSKDCIRCKQKPGNIVIRHAVYCKDCLVPLLNMKFRKVLEPCINKKITSSRRGHFKADGNLLISCSGGLGSSVLLDLIHKSYFTNQPPIGDDGKPRGGKNHPRNESVWDSGYVCYVEVCNAYPEMRDRTGDIRLAVAADYPNLEFVPIRIEDAFDKNWWKRVGQPHDEEFVVDLTDDDLQFTLSSSITSNATPVEALRAYITSLPTSTASASAIRTLVRVLTMYTARYKQCSHLLLGTSLTSLSISLISSISQGAGYALHEELQEDWIWESDANRTGVPNYVRVVRPLRDVVMKECAAYAWWNEVKIVGREKVPIIRGIGRLTHDFIIGLERDYPSTVSTIARTCAKLTPKDLPSGICILCRRPRQRGIQEWKAQISIRSYDESKLADDAHVPRVKHHAECTSEHSTSQTSSLTPYLCYYCHTTLTSRGSRGGKLQSQMNGNTSTASTVVLPGYVNSDLSNPTRPTHGEEAVRSGDISVHEDEGDVWARHKVSTADMKDTVASFLLDD